MSGLTRPAAAAADDPTAPGAAGEGNEVPVRLRMEIEGAVQGVGFRPFIYRLARELALRGWVENHNRGVSIEAEGSSARVARFVARVRCECPAPARVESLRSSILEPKGDRKFAIRPSRAGGECSAQLLPDLATCPACAREVADPADRRFGYPFTNCTRCGPRFSIIRSLPYDRSGTSMRGFSQCARCQREYTDPQQRRFHAQPNACPHCGPALALWDAQGEALASGAVALEVAARALREGAIVALKGLGGFQLLVDARNGDALARLRARKDRPAKPFALLVGDLEQAEALCAIGAAEKCVLDSPEAPILLLPRRDGALLHPLVSPGTTTLGIMLPYTPLHHLLMARVSMPLVATSGNLRDEPICTDENEARRRLAGIADQFLVHDRPIERHVDDSVAWHIRGETRLLRRARGYAPAPIALPSAAPPILAVGAHLKNTVALSVGRRVFVSQHIGDLETVEALAAFERVIADFLRLYQVDPGFIAHDLHPDYASSCWARQARRADGSPPVRIPVQHHHAHMAACLAENDFSGRALAVTWDGTGYGTDGSVWGGEFLLGNAADFERVAQLRPFRLPGGEAAIREPRRVAVALLWEMRRCDDLDAVAPGLARSFGRGERALLETILARGLNTPRTSSAGRLFDAAAALCDLGPTVSFEGQAAMALEAGIDPAARGAYPFDLISAAATPDATGARRELAPGWMLDWEPLIAALIDDRKRGIGLGVIAARFHNALIDGILRVATRVGSETVALCGGCFQNRRLLAGAASRLESAGFRVLLNRRLPTNDGGVSYGQVAVAAARLRNA